MSADKINQEVMRVLMDKTKDKEHIRKLIIDLIWEEQNHRGSWHFKTKYQEIIGKYIKTEEL
jgi:rubrerythrin